MALHWTHGIARLACVGLIGAWQPIDGSQPAPLPTERIRAAPQALADLLVKGRDRSPTFATLLRDIDTSAWIVFVQAGSCRFPGVLGCLLHRVGRFDGQPYLRIVISESPHDGDETIATIGHELQHALEVIHEPNVADAEDIRTLFRHIGYVAIRTPGAELYETQRAVAVGLSIRQELRLPKRAARR